MKIILDFLGEQGLMLLLGTSALLALAGLLVLFQKEPIHRQRIAEATMALCAVFLILASIPLPRFSVSMKGKAPPAPRPLPLYSPQEGDEVIAAEVFKVPEQARVRENSAGNSSGIGVPLPMPPSRATNLRNWPLIWSRLYVGGAVACVFYSILGHLLLHRLVRRAKAADFASPVARVSVRVSAECDRPFSFGLIRPTILLPARFGEFDEARQRHILLHELAHISQRDALGHFLFNLLFPVLYFHPLYWLLRRKTNLARELIADDLAVAGSSRESYVADLLALARDRLAGGAMAGHALGLFQSKTDLYRRMHMLMQTNRPLARRCSVVWRAGYATIMLAALITLGGTLGVRRAAAQTAQVDQKQPEKKNAGPEANLRERHDQEVAELRAQQASIQAKLVELEQERQKLADELAKRKAEGKAGDDLAAVYKQILAQRDKAAADAKAQAAEMAATLAARRTQNFGPDGDFAVEEKANAQRAAMRDWVGGKNGGDGNRDQKEFAGRAQLDLVSLANNYVDAIGRLDLAQLELSRMAGKGNVFSEYEINRAKVDVVTAERKVRIFRAIAEAALEAAKSDLDVANRNVKMGHAPEVTITEAKSRLRIIEAILAQ